jgi:hypothetical protein
MAGHLGSPANSGEPTRTRKWVPAPVPSWPAWPRCAALSSSTSTGSAPAVPQALAQRLAVIPVRVTIPRRSGLLAVLHVAAQVERLRDHEQRHQAQAAEQLEVDPGVWCRS